MHQISGGRIRRAAPISPAPRPNARRAIKDAAGERVESLPMDCDASGLLPSRQRRERRPIGPNESAMSPRSKIGDLHGHLRRALKCQKTQ